MHIKKIKPRSFHSNDYIRYLLIFLFSGLTLFNLFSLSLKTFNQYTKRGYSYPEPGFEFANLRKYLKNIPQVGYLSDKNQSAENNDGRFMMAQYMLAPTALDLNNPNHRYIILDVTSPESAAYFLKMINARVIAITPFGKILVERQ